MSGLQVRAPSVPLQKVVTTYRLTTAALIALRNNTVCCDEGKSSLEMQGGRGRRVTRGWVGGGGKVASQAPAPAPAPSPAAPFSLCFSRRDSHVPASPHPPNVHHLPSAALLAASIDATSFRSSGPSSGQLPRATPAVSSACTPSGGRTVETWATPGCRIWPSPSALRCGRRDIS